MKSSSIFVLFSKLRSQEIEQFSSGVKRVKKFLKGISRGELFLKKVKEFRYPADEKQASLINKVQNFKASNGTIPVYLSIFVLSLTLFGGIQYAKYSILKTKAIEIRLSYSQIKNNGYYNIYQHLGIIKVMEVVQNESNGVAQSPDLLQTYTALLRNIKEKSYRFQLSFGLPSYKNVFVGLESQSACGLLEGSSFGCTSQFEEIYFLKAVRSTFMDSILLMKKFELALSSKDRPKLAEKKDLMAEASTLVQDLVRLVSVFNKLNENLISYLSTLIQSQLSRAKYFVVLETLVSALVLSLGGGVLFFFLNNPSMENISFIKVLPFNLIVKNQYFQICLNKKKY